MDTALSRLGLVLTVMALASVTGACAQSGERIEIPTTRGYDFVDFPGAVPSDTPITGRLILPPDGEPRGAAILSHGAGGSGARQDRAARLLADRGIAAFVLDHFGARGVSSVARDQLRISEQQMATDIFAARDVLVRRLGLDATRIGAVGWSKGATAVTLSAVARLGALTAPGDPPLAFAAAFYPFCGFRLDDETLATPLLMLLAGRDDWTPSAPCVRQANAWSETGQKVSWQLYETASHGFDSRSGRFRAEQAITVRDTSARCTLEVDSDGRTVTLDRALSIDTMEARRAFLAACGARGVTFEGDDNARADSQVRLLAFIETALP